MKILFLNNQFERGGAARVAAILCNGLYHKDHEILLVTDWSNFNHTYPIEPTIPIKEISIISTNNSKFAKIKKWLICSKNIRKYIKEFHPDIIISTESIMFLCGWIAKLGYNIPIFAADHTSFNRKINPVIDFIRYKLYAKADGLSILTKRDEKLLGKNILRKKLFIIHFHFLYYKKKQFVEKTSYVRDDSKCGMLKVLTLF